MLVVSWLILVTSPGCYGKRGVKGHHSKLLQPLHRYARVRGLEFCNYKLRTALLNQWCITGTRHRLWLNIDLHTYPPPLAHCFAFIYFSPPPPPPPTPLLIILTSRLSQVYRNPVWRVFTIVEIGFSFYLLLLLLQSRLVCSCFYLDWIFVL